MNDTSTAPGELRFTRVFEAPRELVFRCMIEPDHLTHFWGPAGTYSPRCRPSNGTRRRCARAGECARWWLMMRRNPFGTDLAGIALRADDIDWTFGSGTPLSGTAQDLLLVFCGRKLPSGRLRGESARVFTRMNP